MSDPAPRRRFRFSLRSLILFILLFTSGTGLWYRWEPWEPWVRGSVLKGHLEVVYSAAYSPDGKRIVTASWDNTARVWDAASGKPLAVLKGHLGGVSSAAYSPDGKCIVTASLDYTARIWKADGGKPLAVLKGHSNWVRTAAYSPDGERIVTASHDKTARVWHRRRPEQWWGVAWLPEFWLTLVLGVAMTFSLWRDSRIMRA